MQEEMTGKAIALVFQGAEGGIDLLKKAIEVFLELQKQKANTNSKEKIFLNPFAKDTVKHGQQSVKDLVKQGQGVENIEINSDNIGLFTSSARKYGVDFAMTKDKNTNPPTHTVFFKGKDTGAITSAFKDFVGREENLVKKENTQSLHKAIKELNKEIKQKEIAPKGKELLEELKKAHRSEQIR